MQIVTDNKIVIYGGDKDRSFLSLEEWTTVRNELVRRQVPAYAEVKVTHSNGRGGWTVIATWDPEAKP